MVTVLIERIATFKVLQKWRGKMVGCFIIKSLSLHLVFATSTTRQLVIPILHVKTARKHSCEFPQHSWQLKTHPDIHVRFVWEIRKESVEDRLTRKKEREKKKKAGRGWLMHYHLPTVGCLRDSGQSRGPAARTVLYNHMWQPVRHPVIPIAAALALCNHIWLWQFASKSWRATANPENDSAWADGSERWSGCKRALRGSPVICV